MQSLTGLLVADVQIRSADIDTPTDRLRCGWRQVLPGNHDFDDKAPRSIQGQRAYSISLVDSATSLGSWPNLWP